MASGRPAPRYAPIGVVFVTATATSKRIDGKAYVPWAILRVPVGRNAPTPGYAPASPTSRTRRPVNVPSRRQPSSAYWIWPRLWGSAFMSSLLGGTHTTGRPNRRAAAATTVYSGCRPALPPNPPPTCGVTMCTSDGSSPSAPASWPCSAWGICVDGQTVSRPSSAGAAAQQSGSIGATAMRWFT